MLHAFTYAIPPLVAVLASPLAFSAQETQEAAAQRLEFEVVGRTDTEGPRPVLLALPPGAQNKEMVAAGHRLYWKEEAERLGWTVISPIAPEGEMLRGENLARVLELVDHVETTYEVEYGRLHVAGVSNGGRSGLELALGHAERFASLSLLPGMQPDLDGTKLAALARLPLAMYVGGDDAGWVGPMQAMSDELIKLGHPPARFTIFEGEGHTPESLTGRALFETLESFRVSAALEDFHDAASQADGPRYFKHFAPDAIYMGTDATERWTVGEFRKFVEPYFSKGRGWTYVSRERHAYVAPGGETAWFDELLDNDAYGLTRGTGAFVRTESGWKMTQYHLTIPVPNDLARSLVDQIRKQSK